MNLQQSLRKLLRARKVSIESYLKPDFYCPEMRSYGLLYLPSEIRYPDITRNPSLKHLSSGSTIQPYRLHFNATKQEVEKILKSPFLIVDNQKNIPNHIILLYKRRIGKYKTTTQIHLINNKVKLVYEQFSHIYFSKVSYLDQIVNSLGLTINSGDKVTLSKDKESGPPDSLVFTDNQGGVILIEESITINARYQKK